MLDNKLGGLKIMNVELKKLIENLSILAGNNAVSTVLECFEEHVNKSLCDGTIEGLNEYIEDELQEWAYNQ